MHSLYERRRYGKSNGYMEDPYEAIGPAAMETGMGKVLKVESGEAEFAAVVPETMKRKIQVMLLLRHGSLGCLVNSIGEELKTFAKEEVNPKLTNHKNWSHMSKCMPDELTVRVQKGFKVAYPKPLTTELVGEFASVILRRLEQNPAGAPDIDCSSNLPPLVRRRIRLMLLFRNRGVGCAVDEMGTEYELCFREKLDPKAFTFSDFLDLLKEMKDEVDVHTVKSCKFALARPFCIEETQRNLLRVAKHLAAREANAQNIALHYEQARYQQSVIVARNPNQNEVFDEKDEKKRLQQELLEVNKKMEKAGGRSHSFGGNSQENIGPLTREIMPPCNFGDLKACNGSVNKSNYEHKQCIDVGCHRCLAKQREIGRRYSIPATVSVDVGEGIAQRRNQTSNSFSQDKTDFRSSGDQPSKATVLFKSQIITLNEGVVNVVAFNVSHPCPEGDLIEQPAMKIKDTFPEYSMWDTIQTVKKVQQTTDIETIRLRPAAPEDEENFNNLFRLLCESKRVGVVDSLAFPASIKSMYLVPWLCDRELAEKLLHPITGPGLVNDGCVSILCIIVRNERVRTQERSHVRNRTPGKRSQSFSPDRSFGAKKRKYPQFHRNSNRERMDNDKDWIETRKYGYVCFPRKVLHSRRVKIAATDDSGKILYPNGPCRTHPEDVCSNCRQLGHTIDCCWNDKYVDPDLNPNAQRRTGYAKSKYSNPKEFHKNNRVRKSNSFDDSTPNRKVRLSDSDGSWRNC